MIYEYPTTFEDKFGKESTTCYSDGSLLRMELRGASFEAPAFNLFELNPKDQASCQNKFEISDGSIQGTFKVEIPIKVLRGHHHEEAKLNLTFKSQQTSGIEASLSYNKESYSTLKPHEDVEQALMEIQAKLPETDKLKSCISCRFASYHPVGSNDFGALICLESLKEQLHQVQDKSSLMQLMDEASGELQLKNVQETYCCPNFDLPSKTSWMYKSFK